jgi:hypothetical protein
VTVKDVEGGHVLQISRAEELRDIVVELMERFVKVSRKCFELLTNLLVEHHHALR